MFYLTELNKDDNSHFSDAYFHILVHRCDINFSEVLYIFLQCIPYSMMNDLNQLLIEMIEYFHPAPPPVSLISAEDIFIYSSYFS